MLVSFLVTLIECLTETTNMEERYGSGFQRVSIHGHQVLCFWACSDTKQDCSPHGGQEVERKNNCATWLSPFFSFYSIQALAYGMVLPTFREGLSTSVNPI
jgi:hypothetical protein